MVAIGSASIQGASIASSVAATQRGDAVQNAMRGDAADRKLQADAASRIAAALGDVAQTDHSPERDADGRTPWSAPERVADPNASDSSAGAPTSVREKSWDADGIRGQQLDLDA